ncbi:DUF6528 family protein [Granulicella sp. dw_53]|uniref:DUF6528 family protein n=1 Tax=Granulicella sp. dw_53 TaxID=2719792 RepID=UPI001BD6BF52|nr:DUF6528 family protein [Granulicella sp. dw_53]
MILQRAAFANDYIAIADQASGDPRIRVMDYTQTNWGSDNRSAVIWSWEPSDSGIGLDGWGLPNDARLRNNRVWGGQCVAILDGHGRLAVVSYPAKVKKWSINVGPKDNVHGIELLPDGNVAVAASTGGWVRLYAASQGESSSTYVTYNLPDAHNVLWDPRRQVLWALGQNKLVQLRVRGTSAAPTLTLVATTILPKGGGHDLEPKYGDTNILWITTASSTWTYNKTTDTATLYQNIRGIKSINNQSSTGQVIETSPHTSCKQNSWCTDIIDFFSPPDIRTRPGAAIYRARVWNPDYQ